MKSAPERLRGVAEVNFRRGPRGPGQRGVDLRQRNGTDRDAEPAAVFAQAERLKRHEGQAGAIEQQLADVSFVRPPGEAREADRQVNRALRRDGLDRQAFLAHRREPGAPGVEPLRDARRASPRGRRRPPRRRRAAPAIATCSGAGPRRPTWPRMSAIRCRAAGGITAQPTRRPVAREALRGGVEDDACRARPRAQTSGGVTCLAPAEDQLPVDLVVAEPGGRGAGPLAAVVLLDDRLADRPQHVRIDRGAGRVERRVEEDEPRVRQMRAQLVDGGKEVRLGPDGDLDGPGAAKIGVVVVVPRRHWIDRRRRRDRAPCGTSRRAAAARRR